MVCVVGDVASEESSCAIGINELSFCSLFCVEVPLGYPIALLKPLSELTEDSPFWSHSSR